MISVRKFAQLVGVSHVAILRAVRAGRLVESVEFGPDGGVKGIDPDKGREEWAMNSPTPVSKSVAAKNQPGQALPGAGAMPSYAQARAVRENYQARIAKLIYEEKIGKLIEADGVKVKAFETARIVRDFVLNIPNRISAELASETDPIRVHTLLTKELTSALDELSRKLKNGDVE